MRRLDRFVRLVAALVGLVIVGSGVMATLRAHNVAVASVRLGFCVLISAVFFRRAAGMQMDAFAWGAGAILFVSFAADSQTTTGTVLWAASAALACIGGALQLRVERNERARAGADAATPRG